MSLVDEQGLIRPSAAEETRTQPQRDPSICCLACGHPVTRPKAAIEQGGCHEHTFRNPAGYSFHVLCFSEAPGCLSEGHPSSEASWFAGFTWTFGLCQGCRTHLGWWYRRAEVTFAGLIATRLARPQ